MQTKHSIHHGHLILLNGKLEHRTPSEKTKYQDFIKDLEENQLVEVFMEATTENGTVPQLAKIHVCIRELAKETGYSFEDMKLEVKRQAGLCVKKKLGGDIFMICKSFGDCSKDELALTVEAIVQIGDTVGINFR